MKAMYREIEIERDSMTKIPKVVPEWEVPIYESKFGEAVTIGDEVEVEVDAIPDPREEFARLVAVHDVDEATKQPHAELAYGRGSQAAKALTRAIYEAFGQEAPREAPVATAKNAKGKARPVDDTDDGQK